MGGGWETRLRGGARMMEIVSACMGFDGGREGAFGRTAAGKGRFRGWARPAGVGLMDFALRCGCVDLVEAGSKGSLTVRMGLDLAEA